MFSINQRINIFSYIGTSGKIDNGGDFRKKNHDLRQESRYAFSRMDRMPDARYRDYDAYFVDGGNGTRAEEAYALLK